MKSQPIDLRCPVRAVSYRRFEGLFRRLGDGDRYCHPGYLEHHHRYALWNWDLGEWWGCPATDLLGEVLLKALKHNPGLLDFLRHSEVEA